MTVKVLVVDDDDRKSGKIRKVVEDVFAGEEAIVKRGCNAYEAGQLLAKERFDLMVLDLNIPMRGGDEPRSDGGMRILENVKRRAEYQTPTHIVGLTAVVELYERYANSFREEGWVLAKYEGGSNDWEGLLRKKLYHIENTKMGMEISTRGRVSPWCSGIFYLGVLILAVLLFAWIGKILPCYTFIIVVVSALIATVLVGTFQLRNDEKLSEVNFLTLTFEAFRRIALLKRGMSKAKERESEPPTEK